MTVSDTESIRPVIRAAPHRDGFHYRVPLIYLFGLRLHPSRFLFIGVTTSLNNAGGFGIASTWRLCVEVQMSFRGMHVGFVVIR